MKTSIYEWLKKEKKFVIVTFVAIAAIFIMVIREKVIQNQAARITKLETENSLLSKDRDSLNIELKKLQHQFLLITTKIDSMKGVLAEYQLQMSEMKIRHKHQLDSLLNVPNDTIYVRLQPLFPNYDSTPLSYRFSGSQIRQIYSGAIGFNSLSAEYTLQGKTLKSCLDLNRGYEGAMSNLSSQIHNLKANINICDSQLNNYITEVSILKKQVKRGKFWRDFFIGTSILTTTIMVLK
jgi:hypothetical protein